ncbi:hypothetical protein SNEBB_008547 [Seison nebaliae]|nr:hypothetical protein SNEBB_008547 [Seison nebaliae]
MSDGEFQINRTESDIFVDSIWLDDGQLIEDHQHTINYPNLLISNPINYVNVPGNKSTKNKSKFDSSTHHPPYNECIQLSYVKIVGNGFYSNNSVIAEQLAKRSSNEPLEFLTFNAGKHLYTYPYHTILDEQRERVEEGDENISFIDHRVFKNTTPTCHTIIERFDSKTVSEEKSHLEILVGTSTGECYLINVSNREDPFVFNRSAIIDNNRVVKVEFIPKTNGDLFLAAYSSGNVYLCSRYLTDSNPLDELCIPSMMINANSDGGDDKKNNFLSSSYFRAVQSHYSHINGNGKNNDDYRFMRLLFKKKKKKEKFSKYFTNLRMGSGNRTKKGKITCQSNTITTTVPNTTLTTNNTSSRESMYKMIRSHLIEKKMHKRTRKEQEIEEFVNLGCKTKFLVLSKIRSCFCYFDVCIPITNLLPFHQILFTYSNSLQHSSNGKTTFDIDFTSCANSSTSSYSTTSSFSVISATKDKRHSSTEADTSGCSSTSTTFSSSGRGVNPPEDIHSSMEVLFEYLQSDDFIETYSSKNRTRTENDEIIKFSNPIYCVRLVNMGNYEKLMDHLMKKNEKPSDDNNDDLIHIIHENYLEKRNFHFHPKDFMKHLSHPLIDQLSLFQTNQTEVNDMKLIEMNDTSHLIAFTLSDGWLKIIQFPSLLPYFAHRSFFSIFTSIDVSSDRRLIIVGSRADIISIFDLHQKRLLTRGYGHCSWINHVTFDNYYPFADHNYRIISVGDDAQLCVWNYRRSNEIDQSDQVIVSKEMENVSLQYHRLVTYLLDSITNVNEETNGIQKMIYRFQIVSYLLEEMSQLFDLNDLNRIRWKRIIGSSFCPNDVEVIVPKYKFSSTNLHYLNHVLCLNQTIIVCDQWGKVSSWIRGNSISVSSIEKPEISNDEQQQQQQQQLINHNNNNKNCSNGVDSDMNSLRIHEKLIESKFSSTTTK